MEGNHILVVGLPESGKSSYIQALDEALKHPNSDGDLRACGLADDRSYIQGGKSSFLAGDQLERTELPNKDNCVELIFEHPESGKTGKIYLPDEKGEVFRSQWIDRQWDVGYGDKLKQISGILLFIHADKEARNTERLGALARSFTQPDAKKIDWDLKEASPQVQLVEILQFICNNSEIIAPVRLSIIVSAWDTIGFAGDLRPADPRKFVAKLWPLLAQYLGSNTEFWEAKYFGVSAYGAVPGEIPPELMLLPPHKRSVLVSEGEEKGELTLPLKWLLKLE